VTFTLVGGGTSGDALGDTFNSIEILKGSNFDDSMTGAAADETIRGKGGDDLLFGGDGNDIIRGGRGNDQLFGGADDDILKGGKGDDDMIGGTGSDTFIFKANQDNDTILDFEDNIDILDFTGFGFATVAEAQAFATQVGANVVYDFGNGDTLTINNITIAALADDIEIAAPPPANESAGTKIMVETALGTDENSKVDNIDIATSSKLEADNVGTSDVFDFGGDNGSTFVDLQADDFDISAFDSSGVLPASKLLADSDGEDTTAMEDTAIDDIAIFDMDILI
jgi:Ca2+-binding RTX toxin-like protein